MRASIAVLFLTVSSAVSAATPTYSDIAACMRASVPLTLQAEDFQIEATDKTGTSRSLEGRFYAVREKDRMKVMLHINSPESVSGASYLVIEKKNTTEDDMYVFLPSVNRVRHVTGKFANGSLLGTDFSYAEVKQISNAFSAASGKYEGMEQVNDREARIVTLKPAAGTTSPYTSIRAWVDAESCFTVKADFYVGSQLRKRMTVPEDGIERIGEHWYLSRIEMENLQAGTRTVMRLSGVDGESTIPSSRFKPATFHLGHER